jgi:ABC-type lipopolysaccharide export system ATPase subunit
MPAYTLIVRTYTKEQRGRTKLCGIIALKNGDVLQKEEDKSTLTELSRALRSLGYLPTNIEISKKCTIEFQYHAKEMPRAKKTERTITANNFISVLAEKNSNHDISDKTFRKFFADNLQFVIYEGCE